MIRYLLQLYHDLPSVGRKYRRLFVLRDKDFHWHFIIHLHSVQTCTRRMKKFFKYFSVLEIPSSNCEYFWVLFSSNLINQIKPTNGFVITRTTRRVRITGQDLLTLPKIEITNNFCWGLSCSIFSKLCFVFSSFFVNLTWHC